MKSILILGLLLFILPISFSDIRKDNLVVFASLSYYGCDFDGDGRGDLSLWDSKNNTLYFQLSSNKTSYNKKFFDANLTYTPVFADYDGDGKTDFGFFQNDSAQWILFLSSNPDVPVKTFLGGIGDLPIPATIDNNKEYEPTVWRPTNAAWLLTDTSEKGDLKRKIIFDGSSQDSVFAGDYDGDGKSDLLNWRPDDGYWHIVKSGTDFDFSKSEHIQHGKEWDIIVPNDYNADGRCDLVFWRPENQTWYFLFSGGLGQSEVKFGYRDDIPLSIDLDGDKFPELATWSRNKKSWNILNPINQEHLSFKWDVPEGCIPACTILQTFE